MTKVETVGVSAGLMGLVASAITLNPFIYGAAVAFLAMALGAYLEKKS